jgi:hypothetical protein
MTIASATRGIFATIVIVPLPARRVQTSTNATAGKRAFLSRFFVLSAAPSFYRHKSFFLS